MIENRVQWLADYRPIPAALPFHASKKRFVSLCCGVRSGKTYSASREFTKRILQERAKTTGPLRYWVIAPTYSLAEIAERHFRACIPRDVPFYWHGTKREMRLPNDITIWFKSTERKEHLVGEELHGFWWDETARSPKDAWLGQIYQRISDNAGWGLFTSTPLGRNWFYDEIVSKSAKRAKTPDEIDDEYDFYMWTSDKNIAKPKLKIEMVKARKRLPWHYFAREYLASFDVFMGQIYTDWNESIHLWLDEKPKNIIKVRYSFDFGFAVKGVLGCLLYLSDGRKILWEEKHGDRIGKEFWCRYLQDMVARHGAGDCTVDPSAPEYISAFNKIPGIRAIKADNNVAKGIETVALAMVPVDNRSEFMVNPKCDNFREEVTKYTWAEEGKKEKPVKENDHSLDMVRYALNMEEKGVRGGS